MNVANVIGLTLNILFVSKLVMNHNFLGPVRQATIFMFLFDLLVIKEPKRKWRINCNTNYNRDLSKSGSPIDFVTFKTYM